MTNARRLSWSIGAEDAQSILDEARKALFVMVGFLALLWIIQLINAADHYQLTLDYGIKPRDLGSLPYVLTAPFLHVSWTHIESNSGPLFIFGFLAAYRGVARFLGLTALVILVSGLADWFTGLPNTVGVGASGVVFGYLGYILVRGFFDRHAIDIMIGAVMALCFAYQFTVLLPHAGIGWQAHIGGLAAGVVGGWVFRDRRPAAAKGSLAMPDASARIAGPEPGGATLRRTPLGQAKAGQYAGPRAELHKQLDDLGL
ncbi:MAG: rhomboid family intramembrane serine protease [Streptosporangiaceae bacterium]